MGRAERFSNLLMALLLDDFHLLWRAGVDGVAESDANILNFPETIKTYNYGRLDS